VNDFHQRTDVGTADYDREIQLFTILERFALYPYLFLVALGTPFQVGERTFHQNCSLPLSRLRFDPDCTLFLDQQTSLPDSDETYLLIVPRSLGINYIETA
jgi:hypothetical protein